MTATATASTPSPRGRLKRLVLARFAGCPCRHLYRLVTFRGRMFLKCGVCLAETEGFTVAPPRDGRRIPCAS